MACQLHASLGFITWERVLPSLVEDGVHLKPFRNSSLEGMIKANGTQAPFVISIKGRFGGYQDFEFRLEWVPWREVADDMSLFKRLSSMLMAFLNGDDVGLSKVSSKAIA